MPVNINTVLFLAVTVSQQACGLCGCLCGGGVCVCGDSLRAILIVQKLFSIGAIPVLTGQQLLTCISEVFVSILGM